MLADRLSLLDDLLALPDENLAEGTAA